MDWTICLRSGGVLLQRSPQGTKEKQQKHQPFGHSEANVSMRNQPSDCHVLHIEAVFSVQIFQLFNYLALMSC